MSEFFPPPRDVAVSVERIPRTQLVHLDVAGVGGLVLTGLQARTIARELLKHAGASGGPPARRSERARGRADARPTGAR